MGLLSRLSAFLLFGTILTTVIAVIPDNDPFYQPPAGFASSAPGTVFKNRTVASGQAGVNATQILYRTTDANDGAVATVATIVQGSNSSTSQLVTYQNAEDSDNSTCSPSYQFTSNQTLDSNIVSGLSYGWTVVVPDYEGFNSSFSVGHLSGYAVLDGLRAAINFAPAGISANASLGGFGYSGGAIATGWAAALHGAYAPELNIKGWSFGGTPANVTSTLQNVEGGLFAGFAVGGVTGMISAYPQLQQLFAEIATPAGTAAIAKARSQCASDDLTDFLLQNVESTQYQSLGAGLLYNGTVQAILAKNTMATNTSETPKAPVFMYHGKSDEVIPYASAVTAANSWCTNGASIAFTTETGGAGHVGVGLALAKNATDWLALRVNGNPPAAGCSNTSVNAGGLPFKREISTSVIDEFGIGDSKWIEKIKSGSTSDRRAAFEALLFH